LSRALLRRSLRERDDFDRSAGALLTSRLVGDSNGRRSRRQADGTFTVRRCVASIGITVSAGAVTAVPDCGTNVTSFLAAVASNPVPAIVKVMPGAIRARRQRERTGSGVLNQQG
jgi:hypothetical protein